MAARFTLEDLERVIEVQLDRMKRHPFLVGLEGEGTVDQLRSTLPRIAFFTLVFQDLLRLARTRCTDPAYLEVARSLELGDQGHDRWFLEDITRLGGKVDAEWLFSSEQQLSRDVSYALVARVIDTPEDSVRLALLLSLEAIAGEFLTRIAGFVQRLGLGDELSYFGARHVQAEKEHEVFSHEGHDMLATVTIPQHAQPLALSTIDDTFKWMLEYADELAAAMRASA
jgi:heme oxygenase-like protein